MKRNSATKPHEIAPSKRALVQARKLIGEFTIIIEPDDELGYVGFAKEYPTVFADGSTAAKCAEALEFSLLTILAVMVDQGLGLPESAGKNKRTEQVNVRLTPREKHRLVRESSRLGFRGIGDLIRAKTFDRFTADTD